jgi:hypothetical protein
MYEEMEVLKLHVQFISDIIPSRQTKALKIPIALSLMIRLEVYHVTLKAKLKIFIQVSKLCITVVTIIYKKNITRLKLSMKKQKWEI